MRCVNALFFFISGFLYFANVKQQYTIDVYKRKTISRIKSLCVPYIIWNTIVIVIYSVVSLCNSGDFSTYLNVNNYWEEGWSQESMGTPLDGPLWFIRDLFIQALLAPLTYVMVKRFHVFYIACLVVLFYFNIGITGIAPVAYLFFAFGALFGIHKISFVALFRDCSKWLLAAATVALLYKFFCSISALEDISHGLLWNILGVAALLCTAGYLKKHYSRNYLQKVHSFYMPYINL